MTGMLELSDQEFENYDYYAKGFNEKKKKENKQELVDNVSCEMEERIKKEMLKIKNTFSVTEMKKTYD